MSSRFVQNKGMWVRSEDQEPGSPGLPFPRPAGAGTPLAVPGCARGLTRPPKLLGEQRRPGSLGKGSGSAFRARER